VGGRVDGGGGLARLRPPPGDVVDHHQPPPSIPPLALETCELTVRARDALLRSCVCLYPGGVCLPSLRDRKNIDRPAAAAAAAATITAYPPPRLYSSFPQHIHSSLSYREASSCDMVSIKSLQRYSLPIRAGRSWELRDPIWNMFDGPQVHI